MDSLKSSLIYLHDALAGSPFAAHIGQQNGGRQPQSIKFPHLASFLPEATRAFRINQFIREVSEVTESWAKSYIGVSIRERSPDSSAEDIGLNTGVLAAMCLPVVSLAQLKIGAIFLTWVVLLEDHLSRSNESSALNHIDILLTLLKNEPGSTEITDTGFARGLQDILREFETSPSSQNHYDRFQDSIVDYLKLLSEIIGRQVTGFHTVLRRFKDAGWHRCLFVLTEHSMGLDLSPSTGCNQSLLDELRSSASKLVVFTLHMYAAAGHVVCPTRSDLTRIYGLVPLDIGNLNQNQDTFDRAEDIFSDYARTFVAARSKFCEKSGASDAKFKQDETIYAQGIVDCVNGILQWPYESSRYFGQLASYVRMTSLLVPSQNPL